MEENRNSETYGQSVMSFKEKWENYWYHYKWHTIVAAITLVMFTVLILQTCQREEYDVHVVYAGSHRFSRISTDGDIPKYNSMLTTLKKFSSDHNGDGAVSVDLRDLYVMTEGQIAELLLKNPNADINESLIAEDSDTLATLLLYSEYFLVLIDEETFLSYESKYEGALFEEIAPYTDADSGIEYKYASSHGIYLGSLPFHEEAEVCDLPANTVVAIRKLSEVASALNKNGNTEHHDRAEQMLRNILSDK